MQVVADPSLSAATRTNSVICVGGSSVFSSTLSNGTGTVGYQWQYSADNTNWSSVVAGTPAGATYTNPTTASMTIGGITATGTYYYRLSATSTGSGCTTPVYSASATLQVVADPTVGTQPTSPATICVGGTTANMTTAGSGGTGTFSYQWQYNNGGTWGNVSNGTPAGSTYTGSSAATFSVTGISAAGTYQYRCIISQSGSGCGTLTSNTVNVVVVADPSLSVATRTNSVICVGGSSVFSSTLSNGTGTVGYQWQYSIDNATWSSVVAGTPAGATYTNQTTASMTIVGITATGTYYYRLSATSTGSGCTTPVYSSSATLQVVADPTVGTQPTSPATICVGGTTANMTTAGSGGTGTFSYQWQYNNGGTWGNVSNGTPAGSTYTGGTATTFSVTSISTAGSYQYRCVISQTGSGCSQLTTNTVTVVVVSDPSLSAATGTNAVICSGGSSVFSSTLSNGTGTVGYQWQYSADNSSWSNVAAGTPTGATYTNPTSASMTVGGITAAGTYYYRLSSTSTGSGCTTPVYSASASLQVVADPSITIHPSGAAICYGSSHTMSVAAANGTPSLTYQWQSSLDNSAWSSISGATSASYTTPALTSTTYYRVIVGAGGSGCGSVTSSPAMVTVLAPLTPGTIADDQTICYNTVPATLSGTSPSGGDGTYTYQWQQQANCTGAWTDIGGATSANYSPPALTQNTCYRRMVTDNYCGTVYSTPVNPTSGLVLHYTCDDQQEPTENLCPNVYYENRTYNTPYSASSWGGDAATFTYFTSGGYNNYPYKMINKTAGGTGGSYIDDHQSFNLDANTTYTISVWMKASTNLSVNGYAHCLNRPLDNLYITTSGYSLTTNWQRYQYTITTTSSQNGTYVIRSIIYDDSGLPIQVYWCGTQVEKKSQATPFVVGTRAAATVTDYSGNGNHGTIALATSPSWTDNGINGGAYVFDGVNDYFKTTNTNLVTSPTSLTISSWFKKIGNGGTYECVLHKGSDATIGNSEYWLGVDNSDYLTATIGARTGVGWSAGQTSVIANVGEWYHLAASWDGSVVKVYINGVYNKQYALTTYGNITYPTRVGASSDGTDYQFNGVIDDVRIYNSALDAAQVAELYSSTALKVTVTPNNTISLTAGGTQTKCINTAITTTTYATTGATGATVTGLPAGVTGSWTSNVVTISGTPTMSGAFTYTVTLTGGCGTVTTTGTITVTPNNTISLTAGGTQTKCINTAITTTTYATTGATGATFSGLPAGVTGAWASNVATISGTPTASGTFNYTVTTTGGCTTPAVTATGTITVIPNNTITLSSAVGTNAQTKCINTAITNITYATTGATGATFSGLPAGVTGAWASNVATISGTPTASGTFNYTVTTTGGCTTPAVTATGTITVIPNNTITLSSAVGTNAQTKCINTAITNITYATTGATGAAVTGLPAGVTGSWASNVVTISGTPTVSGAFTYTVTLTGGCGTVTATGTITVIAQPTASAGGSQSICVGGTATVSGASASNGTITWTENGAGSITNGAATLTPTYTSDAGDAGNTVTLTMTVSNSPCNVATATYSVIVNADPSISTQPLGATICNGESHTMNVVASNGTGGYTYQWQSSPNGTAWTNISGATNASYTTPPLTTTTYYQVITGANGNGCGNITSNPATITVYAPIAPGTISANQTICSGAIPASLTGSNPTGGDGNYSYQWQQQANCTGAWTNISGATSANYSPGALTQNTCYRRMVTDNLCGTAYSSPVAPASNLMLKYTFDDPQEPARNFVNNPNGSIISNGTPGNYQPGWDAALHADAITVSNWSTGYNSGVSSPAIGYHAHWIYGGVDGVNDPCMFFPDQNDSYGLGHRWLGISQSVGIPNNLGLTYGDVVTVSWYQKSSVAGKGANVGLYHYRIAENSYGFETNITTIYVTTVGEWERVSYTTTIGANWDLTKSFNIYVYGNSGAYGQLWVDKVQIEESAYATSFITGTTSTATVTDYSGNGNHGTINAATAPVWIPDGVSGGAYDFNGSQYIDCNYGTGLNPTTSPHTFSMWVKPDNAANNMMYMTAGQVPNSNYRFYVGTYGGKWDMGIQNSSWGGGTINVSTNWTHIAVVMNGSVATLYVNGVVGRTINYTSYTFNRDIYIANHDNNYWWLGYVDDVRIYNAALTQAQVQEISNSSSLMITVNPIPTVTLAALPAAVCIGAQASLSASSPVTGAAFAWNPGSMSGSPVIVTPMATTTYTVTSTAASCSATSTVTVTVIAPPSTGLSSGDYVWSGITSIDWTTPSNWLVFGGGSSYSVAPAIPDNTKNVIIRANAPCASNISHVPTTVSGNCKNLTIETQLVMDGTSSLNIYGNWTNNGIFNAGNGTVTFTGSVTPVTINTGGTGTNYDFYNLTVNKATGTDLVRIASNDMNVTNMLTMTKGNVDAQTNNKVLILGTTTNNLGTIAYTDGFVYGKMRRWFSGTNSGNSTGLFPFGVGTFNRHLLIEYTAAPTGGSLTAYWQNDPMLWNTAWLGAGSPPYISNGSCSFNITSLCDEGYWQVDNNGGMNNGTYNISLRGDGLVNTGFTGICYLTSLKASYNGPLEGDWTAPGTALVATGTVSSPLVKRTGVTTGFSKWGLAGGGDPVPLPISLLSFNAECDDNVVDITWTTATEINNDYFTIQRSTNATDWEFVKNIPGNGNSNTLLYYAATDDNPYGGTSYYRLKQTDFDGSSETFSPVAVICREINEGQGISYYPNPFTSEVVVDLQSLNFDKAVFKIYDILGKVAYEKELNSNDFSDNRITIDLQSLPAGVYTAVFTTDGYNNTSKLVKNF
ncbi:MAG TPA: T9SS type A sorting domain-containing protein [Bacteroidales bacterium]|nr:T9SS type A sorting domain-containing protein [Bacteroidales bacterium]